MKDKGRRFHTNKIIGGNENKRGKRKPGDTSKGGQEDREPKNKRTKEEENDYKITRGQDNKIL